MSFHVNLIWSIVMFVTGIILTTVGVSMVTEFGKNKGALIGSAGLAAVLFSIATNFNRNDDLFNAPACILISPVFFACACMILVRDGQPNGSGPISGIGRRAKDFLSDQWNKEWKDMSRWFKLSLLLSIWLLTVGLDLVFRRSYHPGIIEIVLGIYLLYKLTQSALKSRLVKKWIDDYLGYCEHINVWFSRIAGTFSLLCAAGLFAMHSLISLLGILGIPVAVVLFKMAKDSQKMIATEKWMKSQRPYYAALKESLSQSA